jgi:hypothetical protein
MGNNRFGRSLRRSAMALAGVGMALAFQFAHTAPLLNGGFETGDLTGWKLSLIHITEPTRH